MSDMRLVGAKAQTRREEDGSWTLYIAITGLNGEMEAVALMDRILPKLQGIVLRTLKKMGNKIVDEGKLHVRP